MWITLFSGVADTPERARAADFEPGRFLDFLGDRERWKSAECASEAEKLAGLGYACVKYREGARDKSNASIAPDSATELFVYDIDAMSINEIKSALPTWQKYDCVLHSTHKHTRERPRLRLVVRLSAPVPNAADQPFKRLYSAGARLLRVKHDPVTLKVANFFLGPQHMPGTNGSAERWRFRGAALDVTSLDSAPLLESAPAIEYAPVRPDRKEIKELAKRLSKRKNERARKACEALRAASAGDALCEVGTVHDTLVAVAWECVREWRGLDAEWFAREHLGASCAQVPPGAERWEHRRGDWIKCVNTARAKMEASDAERERVRAPAPSALTETEIAGVERMRGALVVSFGGAYYIYSPRTDGYEGPFRAAQVATAFREYLGSAPGVTELDYKQVNGPPGLKSAMKLNHEYGCTVDAVHYYATRPPSLYDAGENTIKVQAYKWIDWEPEFSACCDDLLHVIADDKYRTLESYLYKFRDLDQPLPALTLVGTQGTWKSQIAQGLSRFWHNKDRPTPCKADKVLFRFSSPLLHNPVIWSDEKLATENGSKGIPERYRESISERVHTVERKGIDPVMLFSATRHVISVNEEDKVFSAEVDTASVEATLIRFLVLHIEKESIEAFEARWKGRKELAELREGSALARHVRWIEENRAYESEGRFWINTASDPLLVWRARLSDEVLSYCLTICIDNLISEYKHSVPGQIDRLPLVCDRDGQLRISPDRINACWDDAAIVKGSKVRKPAPTTIGKYLTKAGFKKYKNERACDNIQKAWAIDHEILKNFVQMSDRWDWAEIEKAAENVFNCNILR